MAFEIRVPRLGWSMDEGTFGEWLKRDGEPVTAGDMVFVLEGDKASQEIESFDEGVLHIPDDAPQPGDTVVVGQLLGYLLAPGESAPHRQPTVVANSTTPAEHSNAAPASRTRPLSAQSRVIATPRARRRARASGLDWTQIQGSGRGGRIRERDVIALANRMQPAAAAEATEKSSDKRYETTAIRRTIAQRMLAGVHHTAPVTLTTKVNARQLVEFREHARSRTGSGMVPSYTDILIRLVAVALPKCPLLNACWNNREILLYDDVNIAFAVDTDAGLVAPVLRNAPALRLEEIARQTHALAEEARNGRLAQHALRGGTFTLTNLGMFGIDFFTPIINLPQSAILGIGRIVDEPVIEEGRVVPGKTMGLSLTFDHRVIDGAPAARWLQQLAATVEQIAIDDGPLDARTE